MTATIHSLCYCATISELVPDRPVVFKKWCQVFSAPNFAIPSFARTKVSRHFPAMRQRTAPRLEGDGRQLDRSGAWEGPFPPQTHDPHARPFPLRDAAAPVPAGDEAQAAATRPSEQVRLPFCFLPAPRDFPPRASSTPDAGPGAVTLCSPTSWHRGGGVRQGNRTPQFDGYVSLGPWGRSGLRVHAPVRARLRPPTR